MTDSSKRTLCIIEDDEGVRASTRLLLETMGFSVHEFGNAEAFLLATEDRKMDCLILDMDLPGMSGLDLLELLRTRGTQTPAVILTGSSKQLAARSTRAGVVAVLRKPVASDALALWMHEIFADRR